MQVKRISKKRLAMSLISKPHAEGLSDEEIADVVGCSKRAVRSERERLGLKANIKVKSNLENELKLAAEEYKGPEISTRILSLAAIRGSDLTPVSMARKIMGTVGRYKEIGTSPFAEHLLDGKNATPFQWLSEANRVLAREGFEPIGRPGSWN